MSPEFTPLGDIQHPRIRTNINLPYHMEEKIGLNTRYLQTLIQIAGIKHVRISTENQQAPKTEVSIMGINNDGSAIAGKAKVETISTHSHKLNYPNQENDTKQKMWPTLNICLNPNEMRENILNISSNNYQELKKDKNWSIEINKAIKQAVRNAGRKNLVQTAPKPLDIVFLIYPTFELIRNLITFDPITILSIIPGNLIGRELTMRFMHKSAEDFKKGNGYRISCFAPIEVDRLALLQLCSRVKPAVVPINKI